VAPRPPFPGRKLCAHENCSGSLAWAPAGCFWHRRLRQALGGGTIAALRAITLAGTLPVLAATTTAWRPAEVGATAPRCNPGQRGRTTMAREVLNVSRPVEANAGATRMLLRRPPGRASMIRIVGQHRAGLLASIGSGARAGCHRVVTRARAAGGVEQQVPDPGAAAHPPPRRGGVQRTTLRWQNSPGLSYFSQVGTLKRVGAKLARVHGASPG